jgi:DNA-binding beta-propeller fold protein YncE
MHPAKRGESEMSPQSVYRYSHTIGFYAQVGRGFNNPVDVAVGHDGMLYVLNRAGADIELRMPYKRVTMCTVDEEYLGDFGSGGRGDGQLMWPVGIAVDDEGRVYISDEALHRISIFDKRGTYLGKWGVQGHHDGAFDRPAGLAFDAAGNLLVVDSRNHRVQTYTRDGTFLGSWGREGGGEGQLNLPWGIAIDAAGNIYVADWRNDRVQKFDPRGSYLASFGQPGRGSGAFHRPAGVTVDHLGTIYVADWGNHCLQVLGPGGKLQVKMRGDAGLSKWAQDYFIANQDELEERHKANLEPALELSPADDRRDESASIEKLFWGPTAVRIDGHGRIYVVDSCRHRIQVYRRETR